MSHSGWRFDPRPSTEEAWLCLSSEKVSNEPSLFSPLNCIKGLEVRKTFAVGMILDKASKHIGQTAGTLLVEALKESKTLHSLDCELQCNRNHSQCTKLINPCHLNIFLCNHDNSGRTWLTMKKFSNVCVIMQVNLIGDLPTYLP